MPIVRDRVSAGELDRRIRLQRQGGGTSDSGEPIEAWSTLGTAARWASKEPVSGTERFGGEQLQALEQIEFRCRWSTDIADLRPKDRLIEPATDADANPIPDTSIYDIIAVLEIGRRDGFRIITVRFA